MNKNELEKYAGKDVILTIRYEGRMQEQAQYRDRTWIKIGGSAYSERLITAEHVVSVEYSRPSWFPPVKGDVLEAPDGTRYICGLDPGGYWYLMANRPDRPVIVNVNYEPMSQWKLVLPGKDRA
jgi:hypothetical protein